MLRLALSKVVPKRTFAVVSAHPAIPTAPAMGGSWLALFPAEVQADSWGSRNHGEKYDVVVSSPSFLLLPVPLMYS